MKRKQDRSPGHLARLTAGVTLAALLCWAGPARADSYPLLEDMNRQTQSLYRDVQSGIVRVQVPVPKWVREAAAQEDPLNKWGQFVDPEVKKQLERQREQNFNGIPHKLGTVITPATQPSSKDGPGAEKAAVGGWKVSRGEENGETVLESTGEGAPIVIHAGGDGEQNIAGRLQLAGAPAGADFAPNNIGLLLDDLGHIMVPLYIERETIGPRPVRIMIQDRQATARFIGSDEKTNLTILRIEQEVFGRPLRMSTARPLEGSLVMLLNPNNASGRLLVWTGGDKDYGIVVGMDGTVSGIARYGQFLGGGACQMVVEQLIKAGSIRRATLGARLTEVRADDPARHRVAGLGDLPALVVHDITPAAMAERAGLQRGDLILQLGDVPVGDLTTWAALLARGGERPLLILRDGRRQVISINLDPEQ